MTNHFKILVIVLLFTILGCVLLSALPTITRERLLLDRCENLERANRTIADMYVECKAEMDRKRETIASTE